jgi:two-component system, NtrC family, sensor kinase
MAETVEGETGPGAASPPESAAPHPEPSQDRIVTRSMLIPRPGMQAGSPEEMICRLEPGTLRWLEISDNLRTMLGQPPERLAHQGFLQYVHTDDRALAEEEFGQACEHGERYDLVLRIKHHSQAWHYMRISSQARYELDGRINHIRCNLRDVTDRVHAEHELRRRTEMLIAANEQLRRTNQELKKTQLQLIQSDKLASLGTLAAGMAHEINNPLAFAVNNLVLLDRDLSALLRLLSLFRQGDDDLEAVRPDLSSATRDLMVEIDLPHLEVSLPRVVQSTHKGLRRVAQIVEKLCGFARLGRAEIGEVDVNESVEQCLIMLSERLARSEIGVHQDLGELPFVRGAVAELNQVILDLLINGIDAIEAAGRPDGQIAVATRRQGAGIVVEITDNGCGIPADVLPRIFDPFFTTKPLGRGMGLGLSLSHGIVAKHGGRIDVSSKVGSGSCFRLYLPLDSDPANDRT